MGAKPTKDVERYRNEAFPPPVKVAYLPGVEIIRYVTSVFGFDCLAEWPQICHGGLQHFYPSIACRHIY